MRKVQRIKSLKYNHNRLRSQQIIIEDISDHKIHKENLSGKITLPKSFNILCLLLWSNSKLQKKYVAYIKAPGASLLFD